jgi:MmoB/DmpM family
MSELNVGKRDRIGVSLMVSAETEATIAWLKDHCPDASVDFRDCYVKIEHDHELRFDLETISQYLGQELDVETFLVNLSSYYGRIVMEDNAIRVISEIGPG